MFILYAISTPFINTYSYINLSYSVVISTFLATIGFSILELSRYYLAGCNKPGLAERVRAIMGKITMITGTIIGLWLFPTVETALIIVFITYTITGIYILSLSPNEFKYPKKEVIIEILSFSKWSLPTAILNDFYHRWDTILLGFMVGYLALGYYDSSLRIAFLATVLGVGISKTSNVKISGLFEMDKNIMNISKQTIIASTFLVMPMLLIIYFNSEFILSNLYGSEYIAAKWYLIGITVIQIFQCYRMQFESIFNSIDNPKITTKISGISVIFNVLTAPLFVILFGGMGVIYSTLLSEIIRILAYEYKFKNNFNSYILPFGVLTQIIIVIILFSIIQLTDIIISLTNIELLILSTVISIIGFYSLQYLFSPETRKIVQDYKNEN